MADERNPFSLTPKVGRASAPPDLAQRAIQKPVAQPGIDGLQIVDALVNFAGVAGSEYIRKTEKSIEADKAVQTSLAMQNMLPTDDATLAGYEAHAAVAIKGQTLGAQARLNALAQQDLTDDQWHEAIKEEYRNQDEYMTANYDTYKLNVEMQKLAAVSMREMIPQVGSTRAASKIGFEIEKRVNSATDVFVNAAANPMIANADPQEMLSVTDGMLNSLQLTASQKDAALEKAILETKNPALIELARNFKGDRSTSLLARSGKIQQVEAEVRGKELADNAILFEREFQTMKSAVLGDGASKPSMTLDEAYTITKTRNSQTDNKWSSRGEWAELVRARDSVTAAEFTSVQLREAIYNPDYTYLKQNFKNSEIQSEYGKILAEDEVKIKEDAKKQGLTGAEEIKFLNKERQKTQQLIADKSIKSNAPYEGFIADLKAFASTNVEATSASGVTPQGAGIQKLGAQAQRASELLTNMSETAQRIYLKEIGGQDEEVLKRYLNELDYGMGGTIPGPQALRTAQVQAKNIAPPDLNGRAAAFKDIKNDTMAPWFSANLPSNQDTYWSDKLMDKLRLEPVPNSNTSKKRITNWLETGVTTTDRGMKLEGTPQQLKEATNMHIDHLDRAMGAFVGTKSKEIESALSGLDMTTDDVFPVTDPDTGMMELYTSHGPIARTRTPMSELLNIDRNYNNEAAKKLWEQRERFKRLKEGGQVYVE